MLEFRHMKPEIKVVGVILLISAIVPALFYVGLKLWGDWHDEWSGFNSSLTISDGVCNIAVIPVMGDLTTYGVAYDETGAELLSTSMTDTLALIGKAEDDPGIAGTMMLIDSGGGSGAAGELIANEIQKSEMPSAAYILDIGASAAYLAATGADTIVASPFASVGSIAVTMSYLDYSEQNTSQGLTFVDLTSGKFKDSGTPDRALTAEERNLFERDLKIWHEVFIKQVSDNRELPIEEVAELADGSTIPASLALDKKLIDQVGNKETVRAWFAEALDLPLESIVFCQ